MRVKFLKTHPDAVIPSYGTIGAAGMDMTAISKEKIYDDSGDLKYISYNTGIALEIPEGYVGLIFPRSSISKYKLDLCNAVGVIDADFRDQISFRFRSINSSTVNEYKVGDKVGQLIIVPYPKIELIEAEELSKTQRGIGGFGSTDGKKTHV